MMTVLDRVPVERIAEEVSKINFRRFALALVLGLLYGLGWVTARVFTVVWALVAWSFAAVKVGWQEGRKASAVKRP